MGSEFTPPKEIKKKSKTVLTGHLTNQILFDKYQCGMTSVDLRQKYCISNDTLKSLISKFGKRYEEIFGRAKTGKEITIDEMELLWKNEKETPQANKKL